MCLFLKKKQEQFMKDKINKIIAGSGYELVLYKKDYKHFGNCIIKLVCLGKANIKIISDRSEIIFNNKNYPMEYLGDVKTTKRDDLILKFIEIVFNILNSDDWRLTGQEVYLLFAKLKEVKLIDCISESTNPEHFHEHCEFCMKKVEENINDKFYCTMDNYYWICKECHSDFKDILKFQNMEK